MIPRLIRDRDGRELPPKSPWHDGSYFCPFCSGKVKAGQLGCQNQACTAYAAPVWRWDVSYMTTHPTRPNLKTQVNVVVQASDREEALNRASFEVARLGWNLGGQVVSVTRRFRVTPG
jgi:hypothetical protein